MKSVGNKRIAGSIYGGASGSSTAAARRYLSLPVTR
jgi:hypothetical protein